MNDNQIDTTQQPELERLATEINQEHAEAEHTFRTGLAHALRCGELLIAAKKLVAHGEWLPWLVANCTVSERTAQAYIRVASRRSLLEAKSATRCGFDDLSFRQGLKLLAEPTADESWQDVLRPNSKYIPPERCFLHGTHKNTTVDIAHSEAHPGYCFVTRLDHFKEIGNSIAAGCKRPVRNDFIEHALYLLRVDVGSFEWEEVPCAPWPCNIWFDGMAEEW